MLVYYYRKMVPSIILSLLLVLSLAQVSVSGTFPCTDADDHVSGDTGVISIKRDKPRCGVAAQDGSRCFAIRTDDLVLRVGDQLLIIPKGGDPLKYEPPLQSGYILSGLIEITVQFKFKTLDNTTMEAQFIQNYANIPIDGDRYNEVRVTPLQIEKFNIVFKKTIPGPIHLEVVDAMSSSGHMLISENDISIPVDFNGNQTVIIKSSPVLNNCSGSFSDPSEIEHEINGPDASQLQQPYKCVNLFSTKMAGQAHYEVDFANFLGLADQDDQLLLDDGSSRINIVKSSLIDYSKRILNFKGQSLTVIYSSPRVVNATHIPFKLTVRLRSKGGLVEKPGPLVVPSSGEVLYTLQPQPNEFATIEIQGSQLTGGNVTISDGLGNDLTIAEGAYLPPVIASSHMGMPLTVSLKIRSKISAVFEYKPTTVSCGGLLFGSGNISLIGPQTTCYWILGTQKTAITINYNDLIQNGCLEIRSLKQENPIFNRCNISQVEILPQFVVDSAYLKVTLPSKNTVLEASVTHFVKSSTETSTARQTNITSLGYPVSYPLLGDSDVYPIDGINKTLLLSVVNLDLRDGEKLFVNSIEINKDNCLVTGDVDISNKTTKLTIQRSSTTDFSHRRGYELVVTEFQKFISVNTSKSSISTPRNLTSLLLKISAPQGERLYYNITLSQAKSSKQAKVNSQTSKISVVDSRHLFGREVYEDEKFNGSSTSNVILINFSSATSLPEALVQYSRISCNQTLDHVCDNSTRCVPADKLCKGRSYCDDKSDLKVICSSGPSPSPKVIEKGVGGFTVFILSLFMFTLGAIAALYGPDVYKNLENRFRSGQYTTFTSTE